MSKSKKRSYCSESRKAKAAQTKERILKSAKNLFESEGFECTTIEKIAGLAGVSIPMVYALFQSKRGILRALMNELFPKEQFEDLVKKSIQASSSQESLLYSAKIARQIYDAERTQMDVFRGVSVLSSEFKELEKEREMRRYNRQEVTIQAMIQEGSLVSNLSANQARDILWTFTGRDIYRMLVIERGWTPDAYEKWLAELLISSLIDGKAILSKNHS